MDTGKYCFGVEDTLRGLELGAVETLIVWENLDVTRHTLRDSNGAQVIIHTQAPPPTASNAAAASKDSNPSSNATAMSNAIAALSEVDRAKFIDATTGTEMEQAAEPQPLLEWLAENYQAFGATLEFVTSMHNLRSYMTVGQLLTTLLLVDRSQEGNQFVKGFGGIGGLLRYKVDFNAIADAFDEDEFYDSDEDYI
jgi:peptide chain release factor subunit 1